MLVQGLLAQGHRRVGLEVPLLLPRLGEAIQRVLIVPKAEHQLAKASTAAVLLLLLLLRLRRALRLVLLPPLLSLSLRAPLRAPALAPFLLQMWSICFPFYHILIFLWLAGICTLFLVL